MRQSLDLSKIVFERLSGKSDYFPEEFTKYQIYLHHTYISSSPVSVIKSWGQRTAKVGCSLVIAGKPPHPTTYHDGEIYTAFPSRFWAFHLGTHAQNNQIPMRYRRREYTRLLERNSIGIQLCNAGPLTWENGKFYTTYRSTVPEDQVIEYVDEYRFHRFYQKYTPAQIESLRQLLTYLCDFYAIPKTYQPDMWDISENALIGKPGIFNHASVRSDINDCHPQPDLVKMLMGLEEPGHSSAQITRASSEPTLIKQETPVENKQNPIFNEISEDNFALNTEIGKVSNSSGARKKVTK